ncbi:hypothetical protein APHWI1_0928 [Anaplasma phagocytophilum str. ApWI1]|uniref:Uncharacterized protein n=1 Tax=Anaplasma phagocytophilum str. ApWI1 TaxID=1359155 RepID=A0A0F3PXK9_ANAPH|nr:hypothetical protein APHWI1_0862 [Anaplasma phagocytophilum str. ApWI1]KJV84707.1 hypothetical protein APHWI1_0928 [Anaplasma phagocytophilum str. ApWI1]KJV99679.1 hypothetical protein OTSANNIE_0105 [Anaplasma phagocytophilum str. Annie]KJV99834.1 hypothetical protein OTSANNIE_0037 [Anaplasma phagocytophilum str. Annie]
MNTKYAPCIKKAILHGAYVHNLFAMSTTQDNSGIRIS